MLWGQRISEKVGKLHFSLELSLDLSHHVGPQCEQAAWPKDLLGPSSQTFLVKSRLHIPTISTERNRNLHVHPGGRRRWQEVQKPARTEKSETPECQGRKIPAWSSVWPDPAFTPPTMVHSLLLKEAPLEMSDRTSSSWTDQCVCVCIYLICKYTHT